MEAAVGAMSCTGLSCSYASSRGHEKQGWRAAGLTAEAQLLSCSYVQQQAVHQQLGPEPRGHEGRVRASPVASPKESPKAFGGAPRSKGPFRPARPNTLSGAPKRPLWSGDGLRAPDRARSEAGSGGPDAPLTHEHERSATVAYLATEVIGPQRRCSYHRGATTRVAAPSSPCRC